MTTEVSDGYPVGHALRPFTNSLVPIIKDVVLGSGMWWLAAP